MSMGRYVVRRLLWMVPSLLGITLVTFVMMDLAPSSRAELAVMGAEHRLGLGEADARRRAAQIHLLRERWGMVDPATGEPYGVLHRYWTWLGRAVTLDFAGQGESDAELWRRITAALPVTLLLNALATLVALAVAIPLGTRLGMAAGRPTDRAVSGTMLAVQAMPEFTLATLLVLLLGGGWFAPLLPIRGLRSAGIELEPLWRQVLDMAAHLALPVLTLAVGPCVVISRFVRESVARAAHSEFAAALRAWGMPAREVRRSALRNGLSPLATLIGILLPSLVSGSVVVESVFSLPGLGRLAFEAARTQDYSVVMAMTLLAAVATLLGLLTSDLVHRAVDPRVELR